MAVETEAFKAAIAGAPTYRHGFVRLFGIPESEIANTLREAQAAGISLDGLEVTTCLRRGEIEVSTRYEPPEQEAYDELIGFIRDRHRDTLFSEDGSTIDQQVATMLAGHRIAVAESSTGGMLAARLTDLPGASAYFMGGLIVYSNEAKVALAGVDPELIERFGAVSNEVAIALADGAMERLDADVGVGITGIAGPDGGSDEKPVGTVCFSVKLRDGADITLTARLPGGRADVRDRSTTVALHLVRRLLRGETDVRLPGARDRAPASAERR
jgi:nicotinamide-nucleotide amidase